MKYSHSRRKMTMISRKAHRYTLLIFLCIALSGCAAMRAELKTSGDSDLGTGASASPAAASTPLELHDGSTEPPFVSDTCDMLPVNEASNLAEETAQDGIDQNDGGRDEAFQQRLIDQALALCQKAQSAWQEGDQEAALGALDQAYAIVLDLQSDGDDDESASSKIGRQKEDLRFMISKRILEIYASRKTTVKGNHNAIPIDLNPHVQKEIDYLTKGTFFKEAFKRSGRYRPFIIAEFKKAGLPVELTWLPLIESGFRVDALSSARALGLWQFIPSTGYKFGLKRDRFVDERLDPRKSTMAAIAYLKELHQIFGDWSTVLAAYNCGEGRVLQVIRSQNVNYLDNFWDLFERLPYETARYVPRFLATLHIVKNPEKYGIDDLEPEDSPAFETISISRQVCLSDVAAAIGTRTATLKALNPELRQGVLPDNDYELKIPPGKKSLLAAKLHQLPNFKLPPPPPKVSVAYHRVKPGESLSHVAKRYGVSVKTIMRANRLSKKNFIVAGKILKIPVSSAAQNTVSVSRKQPSTSDRSVRTATYVVRSGDSLWNIARKFGTTTKEILRINRLGSARLSIGQLLKVPGGEENVPTLTAKSTKSTLKTYQVKNGDIPGVIAQRHNMSLDRLLQVNNLLPESKIYPGQNLYVE